MLVSRRPRFIATRSIELIVVVLLAACGARSSLDGAPDVLDAGAPDASAPDASVTDAGCTAPAEPTDASATATWTTSLHTPSRLQQGKRHMSGDVIFVGALNGALDRDGIHIDAPLASDPFVFRLDAMTGKLVWATSFKTPTTATDQSVAHALAIDADDVFVVGETYGDSITIGTYVLAFPASTELVARSFIAKLSAIDGSVTWATSFDLQRTASDPDAETYCTTVAASSGAIDVGCVYTGKNVRLGSFAIADAPALPTSITLVHLLDGSTPTISRAKSLGSNANMLLQDEVIGPNGEAFFVSTSGDSIVALDDHSTVFAESGTSGVVGELSSNSIAVVRSPVAVTLASRLQASTDGVVVTGGGVAKLDTSLGVAWTYVAEYNTDYGALTPSAFGSYVAWRPVDQPPLVVALDRCGARGAEYAPITHADTEPPDVTIDAIVMTEQDLLLAGSYALGLTFDDGTVVDTGFVDASDWPWSDIYVARRPAF